jgi:hypothetical protein
MSRKGDDPSKRKPRSFGERKPRTPNRFRERELARAVRAAKSAGGERVEIDPVTGKISVILTNSGEPETKDTPERIISKL